MINFIVTSAVNSQYGVFSPQERLQQQLDTYRNILDKFPEAKIFTIESGKDRITDDQLAAINEYSYHTMIVHDDYLLNLYKDWNKDSICKNLCESYAVRLLLENSPFEDGSIVKLSGRYKLEDNFELNFQPNKITLSGPLPTGNPDHFSDIKFWYSVRCMIYGTELRNLMIETYKKIHQEILDHVKTGRYCDTEHALYKHMPHDFINSLRWGSMGVSGILAPYGTIIKD